MKNITYDAAFVAQGAPGNETFEGRSVGLKGYLGLCSLMYLFVQL